MKLFTRVREAISRLPVGRQLYGAFGAVLLLTGAVGGLGLYSLTRVDNVARMMSEKWFGGVDELTTVRFALLESRALEVKHSRAEDKSYHAEYEDKINQADRGVAGSMTGFVKRVNSDAERALADAFGKKYATYQQAQKKVVALGRDKKRQDAIDVSDGLASEAFDEAASALDALSKFEFDGGNAAAAEIAKVYAVARNSMLGLLGAALVVCALLAWAITRNLLRQLGGEPRAAVAVARAAAEGDLSTPISVKSGNETSLMACLQAMQQGLAETVATVRRGSQAVATSSEQIAQGNQDLSERTEQQASALEETAASMEELGSTVKQNADNAKQANQLAMSASTVAVKGGEVVSQVVDTMKGINDSSKKIADIISVIDGIAFQTNILALNAAVEAARAGEQGRGFAVVASEVRSLAGRSADAAKEIKRLITASVERVEQGTTLVDQAGATMSEVVSAIKRVTDIMGEISAASTEQSAGVAQVGEAITQLDQVTQQNAALVEESAAAAESLKAQAQQLVQAVAVFQLVNGSENYSAAPVAHAAPAVKSAPTERRGPNRAKNVTRPKFGAKAEAKEEAVTAGPALRKTGTDAEWTSF